MTMTELLVDFGLALDEMHHQCLPQHLARYGVLTDKKNSAVVVERSYCSLHNGTPP
ncbi:hypothetical protein [Coriobacterium glomerans]|uniref:hypothetical protein n=1 Tax=Coriobacterium glomerans TaxID=33871 RepID=UPI00030140ED|nr:hypothetical protein [Coriobacterium glomerans]